MTEKTGTFVVTHAEAESVVLQDVDSAQVHTLSANDGLEALDVIEATIAPEPPLEVSWTLIDVEERRRVELVDSGLEPTQHSKSLVADADVGEFHQHERAGRGEIHVFRVPGEQVDAAAQDVLEDEETVARAARLEAVRVEVRRSPSEGVLSVRYLPD